MKVLRAYCLCGGAMSASSAPSSVAERIVESFWEVHAGGGHGSTDARTAGRIRRAAEPARSG